MFARVLQAFRAFPHHRSGASAERLAAIGGVVAVACVTSVHLVDLAAKNGALSRFAPSRDDDLARLAKMLPPANGAATRQNGATLDYGATASTGAKNVALDPCTGKVK